MLLRSDRKVLVVAAYAGYKGAFHVGGNKGGGGGKGGGSKGGEGGESGDGGEGGGPVSVHASVT